MDPFPFYSGMDYVLVPFLWDNFVLWDTSEDAV